MATTTPETILAAHALTDCVTLSLPPLRARNHREAIAALNTRRHALLAHAEHLTFLAGAFSDTPEVVDILEADIQAALAQAAKC